MDAKYRPAGHGPARGQCDCGWVNEAGTDAAWDAHVCADYTFRQLLAERPDLVPVIAACLRVLDTDPNRLGYFAGRWVRAQMYGQNPPRNLQALMRLGIIVEIPEERSRRLTCYRFVDEGTVRRVMAALV
jgi:hypothetical protein